MKTKLMMGTLFGLTFFNGVGHAEGDTVNQVVLYQVGSAGQYCLSITPNVSGCVSGTSGEGDTVNLMEFVKGKEVVFRNLSDAPHDMKFTGNNAEDLPPQEPNAADAVKKFNAEDLTKNKITCSFHGAQLSVGYKVTGPAGMAAQRGADGDGHKDGADGSKPGAAEGQAGAGGGALGALGGTEGAAGTGGGNLKITGLADVSKEVLAKGGSADVEKLVSARPELLEQLKEMRPLLAAEISPKIIAANALVKSTGLGGMGGLGGGAPQANGLPAGAGGNLAGGTTLGKLGSAAGGGFGIIREDLTGGENDNEEWVPGSKPRAGKRMVIANGNATVVFGSANAPAGGATKGGAQRGLASVGGEKGGANSIRTQLKPVSRRQINWLGMLQDGHAWLIVALLLAVGWAARIAIAGTRKATARIKK